MKCACGAPLVTISKGGEPMIRTRALVLKAAGFGLICPKCKADVTPPPDLAKALVARLLIITATPKRS